MACCGLLGILVTIELVEGKDASPEIKVQHVEHGKMMVGVALIKLLQKNIEFLDF
jgi:hypothetical protein